MSRLTRRRGGGDDRGAVIVLVAILLGAGVITGLLATVADLGRVYAERRVVQNGADAAALALAQHCAQADANCTGTGHARTAAVALADANAPDGRTAVTEVCGTGSMAQCLGGSGRWTDCRAVDPSVSNYVRVRTATEAADGTPALTPIFAQLLDPGVVLATGACAQAAWGAATTALVTFPILLPICPGVPGGPPVVIARFDSSSPGREWTDCTVDGVSYPHVTAGFSWTRFSGQADLCATPVSVSIGDVLENYTSDPSACGPGQRTTDALRALVDSGASSIVPVVGGHAARGGLGEYLFTVVTFKAMTLVGFKVQGVGSYGAVPPSGWGAVGCGSGSSSCLYASFADAVVPGGTGGGMDLGVRSIALIP